MTAFPTTDTSEKITYNRWFQATTRGSASTAEFCMIQEDGNSRYPPMHKALAEQFIVRTFICL